MQAEDVIAVEELEKNTFSMPWSQYAFLEMTTRKECIFVVVEIETGIVGYCGITNILGEGDITNVAVKPDARGKGIAEAMIGKILDWGKEAGITEFTLEVRSSNIPAIRLYEKLGFQIEGIRKKFYDKPKEDAFIMWKRQEENTTISIKN